LRNGHTTIHSWDIEETTTRQKEICLLLLKNRRKSQFGPLDGNPLSLKQFQSLDATISQEEIDSLMELGILKKVYYKYEILDFNDSDLTDEELELLNLTTDNFIVIDKLKKERLLKIKRISIAKTIESLIEKEIVKCVEERYEFKNTKISSGLKGINRVFMPSSDVFPTLVASDTNDYISLKNIVPTTHQVYKEQFLEEVYFANQYRKITKEEACLIQGFPKDFILPESRARWMKLIGNSVSVPVIDMLIKSIIATGVLEQPSNGIEKNKKEKGTIV
jgi:DNA (cytosine-5)-methyltransferase 1